MPERYRLTWKHLDGFAGLEIPRVHERDCNALAVGDDAPVIRRGQSGLTVKPLAWGIRVGEKTVCNTKVERAETLRERLLKGRCLVPASGWYEFFRTTDRSLEPMLVQSTDETGLCFAGLWAARVNQHWGRETEAFSILTAPSGASTLWLNHRMPVVVPPEHQAEWISEGLDFKRACEVLAEMILRSRTTKFEIHPVPPLFRHILATPDFGKPLPWWKPIYREALGIISRRQFLCSPELAAELAICDQDSWTILRDLWERRFVDYRPNPALGDLAMWAMPVQDELAADRESHRKSKFGSDQPPERWPHSLGTVQCDDHQMGESLEEAAAVLEREKRD